ncbi:hypothetical protein K449DRAFT_433161 [Hypoxylon sp. EC38]|nr:hypothetical protein K449DRAFT_433161 [Hypoxylon sp. EC38]
MPHEVPGYLEGEDILKGFNLQFTFKEAYQWSQKRIFEFLDKTVEEKNPYEVPKNNLPTMRCVKDYIHQLSYPDGKHFQDPEPGQFIYRKRNDAWEPDDPNTSIPRFLLLKFPTQVEGREYFILFDLLATFVSLMGPAPAPAKAKNFYIPLILVLGSWCQSFHDEYQASKPTTEPRPPAMLQCTWKEYQPVGEISRPPDFFLGCSLGGAVALSATDPWLGEVEHARFDLIDDNQFRAQYKYDENPTFGGKIDQIFGVCAETYPFMKLMRYATSPSPGDDYTWTLLTTIMRLRNIQRPR